MKERPILFSTPMVKAILSGQKTMTRRIIKPQPDENGVSYMRNPPLDWEQIYRQEWKPYKWDTEKGETFAKHPPYGYPSDRLWVRETFSIKNPIDPEQDWETYIYKTDDLNQYPPNIVWKPSIFMPRSASRITLEITDIKVERLQDISEEDAKREGIIPDLATGHPRGVYYTAFMSLWESINGKESWNLNPWVWCISFKKL